MKSLPDLKKIWKKHKFLLGTLILVILLRLPLLFEPFTYADEGIYLTLGQAVRRGLVLYQDIHDNKPPMLYLIAAAAGSFPVYRLIHFLWSFATIFAFWKLSQLIFLKNQKAVILSTSIFAILTSLHTFEGNIANAENFMLLPIITGFFIILKSIDKTVINHNFVKSLSVWFLVGVLFSLATLFKVPAVFDFAAALIFIFLIIDRKKFLFSIQYSVFSILGFLTPILITILYFASQNALPQYLTAAFLQNLPYLSSWGGGKTVSELPILLLSRAVAVVLVIIFLFLFRKKVSLSIKLIVVWFSFSLFAALLSSRPYPHYLIQVLPPLCLSFGLFFRKKKTMAKLIPLGLGIIFLVSFAWFRFWYYPNLSYLSNFYQFLVGKKDQTEYFRAFGEDVDGFYQTAYYIRTHTLPGEKIFIWGNDPQLYPLSYRLPVGRYTVAYHIIDFDGYQETLESLEKNPPRYLIITGSESRPFPQLTDFVQKSYLLETEIDSTQIFHRRSIMDTLYKIQAVRRSIITE